MSSKVVDGVSGWWALLELFVLCGFVVTQPLLDVTGKAPDFSLFHRLDRGGIVALALLVAVAPALLLWVAQVLARVVGGERLRGWVHVAMVAGLLCVLAVEVGKKLLPLRGRRLVVVAAVVAVVATLGYVRWSWLRLWLRYLAPAPLVFVLVFGLLSPTSKLILPSRTGATSAVPVRTHPGRPLPPVVMIFFDEFPLRSLLDSRGEVDGRVYPNFAGFAAHSTWYRNATGVSGWTPNAVPVRHGRQGDGQALQGHRLAGRHPRRSRRGRRQPAAHRGRAEEGPDGPVPQPQAGPARPGRPVRELDQRRRPAAHAVLPPRAAAPRPVEVPARRARLQRRLPRQPGGGRQHLADSARPAQPEAAPPPARLHRQGDWRSHPAPEGPGTLRQVAGADDRRPRRGLHPRRQDPHARPKERRRSHVGAAVHQGTPPDRRPRRRPQLGARRPAADRRRHRRPADPLEGRRLLAGRPAQAPADREVVVQPSRRPPGAPRASELGKGPARGHRHADQGAPERRQGLLPVRRHRRLGLPVTAADRHGRRHSRHRQDPRLGALQDPRPAGPGGAVDGRG